MAVDDAAEIGAGRQGAEGWPPSPPRPGGAEGVGDRLVGVADQQRALQGQRHPLDHAAGAGLDRLELARQLGVQGAGDGGPARLAPAPSSTSAKKASSAAGLLVIARSTSRH